MTPAQRPLSPHLQIYRPQITSVLSITHRATGLALAIGSWLLVWWLLAAAAGRDAFATAQWFWGSWIGLLLLFGWSYSLFYHLCNGIRHLVWDCGYGFDLRTTYRTGWTVLIVSLVLTLLAWSIGLALRGAA
jgi:succinate dehydrogenase / fumarate reductase cytochrome b subunit